MEPVAGKEFAFPVRRVREGQAGRNSDNEKHLYKVKAAAAKNRKKKRLSLEGKEV